MFVMTLGRDEERRSAWIQRMLDFAMRLGVEVRLYRLNRTQAKGKWTACPDGYPVALSPGGPEVVRDGFVS